jgi:hypothetical protein
MSEVSQFYSSLATLPEIRFKHMSGLGQIGRERKKERERERNSATTKTEKRVN